MKKLLLIVIIFCSGNSLSAQANLDSLWRVWQDETQSDSNRVAAYKNYIWDGFSRSNPDTAFILAQNLLSYGEQHNYAGANAYAYKIMGLSNHIKSNFPKAMNYYQSSLKIFQEIGDKTGSASVISNIGGILTRIGDYPKALDYYQRSLKIAQELGNNEGMADGFNNIGVIYKKQGDYPKALDYYQHSLKISERNGDKEGSAYTLNNIGAVYLSQGDYIKALDYFQRSLKVNKEIGDKGGIARAIVNIGEIYQIEGDYNKALDYYHRSLKICEEIGYEMESAYTISSIGTIYSDQDDYSKALEYCKRSLSISQEIGALDEEKGACQCLYDTYKAMGKGNEALVYMEKIQVIDDSLNTQETAKKLQQMEFAKQMFADSIASAEKERLVEEAHKEEVRQKDKTRNIAIGGGLFLLLLAGGIYSRLRYVRKSKAITESERDRSDNLLLNILPADIAAELKANGKAEARDFDKVSILFTDFKEFTQTSAKLTAHELVSEINTCFEAFDAICEKYKVEKIKTIGDSYMGAGGLPVPSDDSVKNTVLAGLEMQKFITERETEQRAKGQIAFQMRVGIHTGPVVAGIVGVKKFQYDIWGDTVNTASRMESSGEVGKVNISQATYELLQDDADFSFESRGKIEAKGKGEIEMYFVAKT